MTLHEAIVEILIVSGKALTTQEIANELNRTKTYVKKDGSEMSAFQVHARTKNYSNLFNREGNLVSLKDSFIATTEKPNVIKTNNDFEHKEIQLMDKSCFKTIEEIDIEVHDDAGIYCIRIYDINSLPEPFNSELTKRKHNIIYIGTSLQSLKKRMLYQGLKGRGSSTLFRSLGAMLGYKPPFNSNADKKNKRNYKFSISDVEKIDNWINSNLLVNWIYYNSNLNEIEDYLLRKYKPLLNISKNPHYISELLKLRNECEKIANGISEDITLHNAIEIVLKENGKPLSSSKIAQEINSRQLYFRKDGMPVPSAQIHMRISHYAKLFSILDDGKIYLKQNNLWKNIK